MDEIMMRILDMMSAASPYAFWAGMVYMVLSFLVKPVCVVIAVAMVAKTVMQIVIHCSDNSAYELLQRIAGTEYTYPMYSRERKELYLKVLQKIKGL